MAKQTKSDLELQLTNQTEYANQLKETNGYYKTQITNLQDENKELSNKYDVAKASVKYTAIAGLAFSILTFVGTMSLRIVSNPKNLENRAQEVGLINEGPNYKRYAEANFDEITIQTDFDYNNDENVDARIFQSIPCDWEKNLYLKVFKNGDGSFTSTDVKYVSEQLKKAKLLMSKNEVTKEDIDEAQKISDELSLGKSVDYEWSALSNFEDEKDKNSKLIFMYKLEPKEK